MSPPTKNEPNLLCDAHCNHKRCENVQATLSKNGRVVYNDALLQKIISEHGVSLKHGGDKLTGEIHVTGVCISEGCSTEFTRQFRSLYDRNQRVHLCCEAHVTMDKCIKRQHTSIAQGRCGYVQELLDAIMAEHNVHITYADDSLTKRTLLRFTCVVDGCDMGCERTFFHLHNKGDVLLKCPVHTADDARLKSQQTHADVMGQTAFNQALLDKIMTEQGVTLSSTEERINMYTCIHGTCIEKECDCMFDRKFYCMYNYATKELRLTCKWHTKLNRNVKYKETCLKNWGVEYPLQHPDVIRKSEATSFDKYGVRNHMQNPDQLEKYHKARFKRKPYTYADGTLVYVQGYEPHALKLLEESGYTAEDILTSKGDVPEVWYTLEGDEEGTVHRYFLDIYLPATETVIEVKSLWTFNNDRAKVGATRKVCEASGYVFKLWIFDHKGNLTHTDLDTQPEPALPCEPEPEQEPDDEVDALDISKCVL